MAKIEMDLSEYQEIQKVNTLLEQSLAKEQEYRLQIDKLKQEKIDAMEANSKSVTIVKRTERTELLRPLKPEQEIMTSLFRILGLSDRFHGYRDFESMARMNFTQYDHIGKPIFEQFTDAFFDKIESESFPVMEEVIHKGLDDIKNELREEAEKGVKDKLARQDRRLAELKEDNKKLAKYKRSQEGLYDTLLIKNEALSKDLVNYEKQIKDLNEITKAQNMLLDKINHLVLYSRPIFNMRGKIKKILQNN